MLTLNGYYTEKVKWKVKIRQTLQHLSTHKALRIPKIDREPDSFDFRKENVSETPAYTPKESVREEIRYIEKPHPKITEIRIFFDNGTYQVFKPEKTNKIFISG